MLKLQSCFTSRWILRTPSAHHQHHHLHRSPHTRVLFNISFLFKPCNLCFHPMNTGSCPLRAHPSLVHSPPPLSLSSDSFHRALIKERSGASIRPREESRSRQDARNSTVDVHNFFVFGSNFDSDPVSASELRRIQTPQGGVASKGKACCCPPPQVRRSQRRESPVRTWHRKDAFCSADRGLTHRIMRPA